MPLERFDGSGSLLYHSPASGQNVKSPLLIDCLLAIGFMAVNPHMKAKKTRPAASQIGTSDEERLADFIDKFDSGNAFLIRSVRKTLRRRMPTANELVYDNYNFFVIGYCSTERPSDCIVSIAAAANGVGLSFYHGAFLPDPHGLLLGSGSQNRFVRIESAATLVQPGVEELFAAAIAQAANPLPAKGRGKLVIRSISKKQKARRKATK
jgi:hypothetical protein